MLTVTVTTTAAGHARGRPSSPDRRGSRDDRRGQRSEPDCPRGQGVGVGCRLVHRAVRAHAPGALPSFEEGHGCALRKDPWRSRDRRVPLVPTAKAEVADVRGRAGHGEGRGPPAHRCRPADVGGRAHRGTWPRPTPASLHDGPRRWRQHDAAKAAAAEHIEAAVADVSSRVAELATGRRPDPAAVTGIVSSLMAGGVK